MDITLCQEALLLVRGDFDLELLEHLVLVLCPQDVQLASIQQLVLDPHVDRSFPILVASHGHFLEWCCLVPRAQALGSYHGKHLGLALVLYSCRLRGCVQRLGHWYYVLRSHLRLGIGSIVHQGFRFAMDFRFHHLWSFVCAHCDRGQWLGRQKRCHLLRVCSIVGGLKYQNI